MKLKETSIAVSKDITLDVLISSPTKSLIQPTLALLHFWGGSNRAFYPIIALLENKHNIIAPSLRGWGRSTKPDEPQAYHITDYADDVVSLLTHLRYSNPELLSNGVVLVGHSMGGKVAQVLTTYSEMAPLLKGMALIAPAPAGRFALPEDMREQQVHAYQNVESASFVFSNVLLGRPSSVDEVALADLAADATFGGLHARAAWPTYGMAEDYEDSVVKSVKKYRENAENLKVLIIVGELDRVETPSNVATKVAMVLKDASAFVTFEILPGVGHLAPVEAPGSIADFLDSFVNGL